MFLVEAQLMLRLRSVGSRTRNAACVAFPFLLAFPLELIPEL